MTKEKNKKKKYRSPIFYRYLAYILFIVTIAFLVIIFKMNMLPFKYYLLLTAGLIIIVGIFLKVLLSRGKFFRIVISILSFILIIGLILIGLSGAKTINFIKDNLGIETENYKIENYQVLVLKNSKYTKLDELKGKKVGTLLQDDSENSGLKQAIEKVDDEANPDFMETSDAVTLSEKLLAKNVEAILIEESQLALVTEEDNTFANKVKKIYSFEVKVKVEDVTNKIDITKEPFNIYISGIDTFGSIKSVSRSDVNIVMSINPKTGNILLTSIPRDYYVKLHGISSYKDKLTHAGMYGVEKSVKTIEDLLAIKINYYVKVNFTSIIKVVDTLGGVNVNSKYSFTSKDGYKYSKGINVLNGKKALSFVRERKAFGEGDRVRGENQEALLTALIKKVTSPSIIIKYNSLLKSLSNSFTTNLDEKSLTEFIKMQIDKNINWNVDSISLDGTNGFDYTYSYKSGKLYVMIPNEDSINEAKNKINALFKS